MELTHVAFAAVDLACSIISEVGDNRIALRKGDRDYSTEKDIRIELAVRKYLQSQTPGCPLLAEEFTPNIGRFDRAWVFDPIDGTVNFSRNHPLFGVSLALVTPERPLIAVIALPGLSRRYHAEDGAGAYLNGRRLSVSKNEKLIDCIVAMGDFAKSGDIHLKNVERLDALTKLSEKCLRVRMHGSAAVDMCLVADGTIDASVILSNLAWDVQAGVLLVRESGGSVVDRKGREHTLDSRETICTNKSNQADLLAALG
jgi:myo-inositol-1(or 4)-monophosphatase